MLEATLSLLLVAIAWRISPSFVIGSITITVCAGILLFIAVAVS